MQLLILGKTPLISLAELENLVGHQNLIPRSKETVEFTSDKALALSNIGGVQKISEIIDRPKFSSWQDAKSYIVKNYSSLLTPRSDMKLKLGISLYGFGKIRVSDINALALTIKTKLKNDGVSCRVIANKQEILNAAQVKHGKLLSESGFELLIVKTADRIILAKTTQIQDIDSYAMRDQARPNRDATVGMLPPKLAQTIINLSGAKPGDTVLDPFCGTGVLLQEALLMGMNVVGTDIESRMIEYTQRNLDWLTSKANLVGKVLHLGVADATNAHWNDFDIIACETYLGRPLSSAPDKATLTKIISDTNTIHKKFLLNVAKQTPIGFRMCIAVPAWYSSSGFKHLPALDSLTDLGYNRISFVITGNNRLIYHRNGQFVARELVVIERI